MSRLLGEVGRRPVLVLSVGGVLASWAVLLLPSWWWPGLVPVPVLVLGATWGVLLPGALLVTGAADGAGGVRRLLGSATRWPSDPGRRRVLLLLLALPTSALGAGLLTGGRLVRPSPGAVMGELLALVSAFLVIHLAEEAVWTGVVQHRLSQHHHPVVAAVLTTAPFTAVHLPLLVVPGVTAGRLLTGLGGLLVLALVVRLLLATVAPDARCVLPAALLHAVFNASANEGRLLDHVLVGPHVNLLGTAAALLVAVVALVPAERRRRSRPPSPRSSLRDAAPATIREPASS